MRAAIVEVVGWELRATCVAMGVLDEGPAVDNVVVSVVGRRGG